MKKQFTISISILLFLSICILILTHFSQKPQELREHAAGGTLSVHVVGNKLINQRGVPVQLLGVNVSAGGDCIPISNQPIGILYPLTQTSQTQTVTGIAHWHANVVRITMNEDCWLGINGVNPAYSANNYQTAIVSFINELHGYGMYVIVDMHTNAPSTYVATSQQVMADADHATLFWQSVASLFKDDPAVMFEAYNEPHITTINARTTNPWQCWRDGCAITETDQNGNQPIIGAPIWQALGMQAIITTIRSVGATNPILIGGLNWSEDLTQFIQYLPTDPQNQIIAVYHNYMSATSKNAPAYWDSVISPIAQKMPVITTEMGEKDGGSTYNTQYLSWADTHSVSYIPWAWGTASAYGNLGLLSSMDGTPSTYGLSFYNHFHLINLGISGTPQPTVSFTPTPTSMLSSSPIPSLSITPHPSIIATNTPQPSPTGNPGDTNFDITLCPHGLGNCGDNVNPNGGGNTSLRHRIRTVTISLYDKNNNQIGLSVQGVVSYISGSQNFQGVIDMGSIATGQYFIKIKMDGFLTKQMPGIVTVTHGQQLTLSSVSLVTGDINNDNKIDISDYSALIDCYGSKITSVSCLYPPTAASPGSDILDDGPGNADPNKTDPPVDGGDYNEFLRELSVQMGQ